MSASPYPLLSSGFARAYWITLRPYLFFVSGVSGLLGLAMGRATPPLFAGALAAFFLSYGLGQALTDVTQTDTDALSSPYRPLARGLIRRRQVLWVSLGGLALCALTFLWANPWTLLPSTLGVLGLATYTPMKRRWWAGPLWNSWIVALLPLLGLLCDGRPLPQALGHPALLPASGSVLCSYATFVLLGYLKDVEADRATGYCTAPVRFGRRPTVAISAVFLGTATTCTLLLGFGHSASPAAGPVGAGMCLAGWALMAAAHLELLTVKADREAHRGIAAGVRGYVVVHLGEAVLLRPALAPLALVLALAFECTLRRRPCKEQI